jgi:hypothetical protein
VSEPIWWCPECKREVYTSDEGWVLTVRYDYHFNECPGTPIDLIAERARYQAHVVVLEGKVKMAAEMIDSLQAERERLLAAMHQVAGRFLCPCSWCEGCIETITEAVNEVGVYSA